MPSGAAPKFARIATRPFKRSLLGYRRSEVDEAIAARDSALEAVGEKLAAAEAALGERQAELEARTAELGVLRERIDHLERVAERLSEHVVERGQELRRLRKELAEARERSHEELRSLAALATELEQVRAQARGQATRIRLAALREAAEISERIAELTRRPAAVRDRLLDSVAEAIRRIGGEAELDDEEDELVGEDEPLRAVGEYNGHETRDEKLFEGLVEVEIGPLSDFSQLVGFEDAASGIGATSEISVTGFTQGRATLEVQLDEPVELLRELEERAPFEFKVRDLRRDRLVLDVDEDEQQAA